MTDHRDAADGPGGGADTRGALNNITPDRVLAALGEVKLGRSVSLASPIEHEPAADNPHPSRHTTTPTRTSTRSAT